MPDQRDNVHVNENGDWECRGCGATINAGVFAVVYDHPRRWALSWIQSHADCQPRPVQRYVTARGVEVVDRRRSHAPCP